MATVFSLENPKYEDSNPKNKNNNPKVENNNNNKVVLEASEGVSAWKP